MDYSISLKDSLCGCDIQITNLNDKKITYSLQHVISPGEVIKIENEGMPSFNSNPLVFGIKFFFCPFNHEI